jgi:hypothetical protein
MTAMILSISDLNTTINHEPRIRDLRLAERLGYEQPRDIRKLIVRNEKELRNYGEVCATVAQTAGTLGGRPGTEYFLNEGQLLLLCMFSETAEAATVRKEIIDLFMAARRKALPPPSPQYYRVDSREERRRANRAAHAKAQIAEALERLAAAEAADPDALRDFHRDRLLGPAIKLGLLEESVNILVDAAERARSILNACGQNSLTAPLNKKFD